MMRTLSFFVLMFAAINANAQILPRHQLHIQLYPGQHRLSAEDHVILPPDTPRTFYFALHRNLDPVSPDAEIKVADIKNAQIISESWLQQYQITLPQGKDGFTLKYSGEIFHPPQQDAREARSFQSTPGIIAFDGAVLNGESGWYPLFNYSQVTFSLEVAVPQGWHAVSQGKRVSVVPGRVEWQESQPQNEIYLIAAPFAEYIHSDAGVESLVYLRKDDAALAQRYLDATSRYIALYQKLIGPYPYAKFALVENFWETGYGMPSFTLLGSQVIRLPFIVDSSYPHEILHNWWGNGVYVDYAGGNWSEGLTAYLADHLLQEQKGNGAEYRRSTLQKYADFVSTARDFPLTEFHSRHSEQSEAIGYGKAMMMFHMLRRQTGDEVFINALRKFYRDYRFKAASFTDLEQTFLQISGKKLKPFFTQWLQQTGAPQLRLVSAQTRRTGPGYELDVKVEQTQAGPAYALELPLVITLAGQDTAYPVLIDMEGKQAELHLSLTAKPLRVDLDPEFDLFRRLDRAEIPPAFSQISGAEKLLIVLPRKAPEMLSVQYREIAQAWQKQPARETRIVWDDELDQLPDAGAVWLFGWENNLRGQFKKALETNIASMTDEGVELNNGKYQRSQHALALTAHIGKTPTGWLAAPDAAMLPVLARKLPHYSKYSYAAFSGPELNNLAKGVWPVTNSPLARAVKQEDGSMTDAPRGKMEARVSLAR